MSSYRVVITIGELMVGVRPESVLPAVGRVARELAVVEAEQLAVVRGEPRLTVRFTGDDDDHAQRVGAHAARGTAQYARVTRWSLVRMDRGRWVAVSPLVSG